MAERAGGKMTVTAIALSAGRRDQEVPQFAASLDAARPAGLQECARRRRGRHHPGLLVAVLRDVDKKGVIRLSASSRISEKARASKLARRDVWRRHHDLNLGGIGGVGFSRSSIGESRSRHLARRVRPVWDGTQFQPRLMLPLTLSYDPRVIDGDAARFALGRGRVREPFVLSRKNFTGSGEQEIRR